MKPVDTLNMNLYPAYLAEILDAGEAIPGVPDYRHIMARGYEPGAYRIPDADNTAVVPKGKFEQKISLPVSSYVWGFSGYSSDAAGFRVQVIDVGTGTPFFDSRVYHKIVTGQDQTIAGGAFPIAPLDKPRLVIEPGLLKIQIENLAAASNQIYFVIWTSEPKGPRQ